MFGKSHDSAKGSTRFFKLVRLLSEKGGDKLGSMTNAEKLKQAKAEQSAAQAKKTSSKPADNAFQEQIPKLTKKLFGSRLQKPMSFIGRFVPAAMVQNATDAAFLRVAQLAEQWSKLDLPEGFVGHADNYDDTEKAAFAAAVANQNRAYAAAGSGVTGITGLLGTVVDLLWLLLLSLRMIYQTAAVYGETLTGAAGAKRAFDILGSADLSMLTEKQAVLISIGAAGEIAEDIDLQVLEGLVKSDSDVAFFREAIAGIAEQLNISLNFSWLMKFLPVATGVTSAVYSVYIMNEIAAVVSAEYTGKPVHHLKLIENKSDLAN